MAMPFKNKSNHQKRPDRYISTRGGMEPVNFAQAVMMGLAPDGGLLLPEAIPTVSPEKLRDWSGLNYNNLAYLITQPFVGDSMSADDLFRLIERSYATFQHPQTTPVVQVDDKYVLELFHGLTASFKDVALQLLGNLFEYFLTRDGGHLNILGATSGDTGSAAIYGVRGKKNINIFMLHPKGWVSPIQERQMTTVLDKNVHNIAISGTFDDCQRIVKELMNDATFKEQYRLGAVNSINWARIMAQIVYYFYAWGQVSGGDPRHKVTFAVPTGNFGDIFAGYLAKRMGCPIERLIIATNRNNVIERFVNTGRYEVGGGVHQTLAPAMDVEKPSNAERYLYYLMDEDSSLVELFFEGLKQAGRVTVSTEVWEKVQADFFAHSVLDDRIIDQILQTYDDEDYILDPHTATAVRAAKDYPGAICLATAHPAKFDEAVQEATGTSAEPPPCLQGLMDKQTRCVELPANAEQVAQYIRNHAITA